MLATARTNSSRRVDHRRTAEGVSHQEPDDAAGLVHEHRCLDGVGNLVRERTIAPIALGVAEPEVVEAQHPDPLAGQLRADPARCGTVLAQGEAVGEHAPSPDRDLGMVDQASQSGSARAGEPYPLGHVANPFDVDTATQISSNGGYSGRHIA